MDSLFKSKIRHSFQIQALTMQEQIQKSALEKLKEFYEHYHEKLQIILFLQKRDKFFEDIIFVQKRIKSKLQTQSAKCEVVKIKWENDLVHFMLVSKKEGDE